MITLTHGWSGTRTESTMNEAIVFIMISFRKRKRNVHSFMQHIWWNEKGMLLELVHNKLSFIFSINKIKKHNETHCWVRHGLYLYLRRENYNNASFSEETDGCNSGNGIYSRLGFTEDYTANYIILRQTGRSSIVMLSRSCTPFFN